MVQVHREELIWIPPHILNTTNHIVDWVIWTYLAHLF